MFLDQDQKRKRFDVVYSVSGEHFDGTKLLAVVVEKCKQPQLNSKRNSHRVRAKPK